MRKHLPKIAGLGLLSTILALSLQHSNLVADAEAKDFTPVASSQSKDASNTPNDLSLSKTQASSRLFKAGQQIDEVIKSQDASTQKKLQAIASQPAAVWLGDWDIEGSVNRAGSISKTAKSKKQTAVFVIYGLPNRDCGGQSAGGFSNNRQYVQWVKRLAQKMKNTKSFVILEPDALADTNCWGKTRASALRQASKTLKANNVRTYLDVGHSNWNTPALTASRMKQVGVNNYYGFSTNVSNFNTTSAESKWALQVSKRLQSLTKAKKHYVIDVSRNGNGSNNEWCNPSGRALGNNPKIVSKNRFDAQLWVKAPGESDGYCNGGPAAGEFFIDYALALVNNR